MISKRLSFHNLYSKLVGVVVLLFIISLGLSIQTFQSYSMGSQQANQLLRLANDIKFYDQLLTHDALVGAITGDTYHALEYNQTIVRLDKALNDVVNLDPSTQSLINEIDEANRNLIVLEQKAFDLSGRGDYTTASEIILSDVYAEYKLAYSIPLTELIDQLNDDFDLRFEQLQINLYRSIALIFILLGLVVMVLSSVYYRSTRRTQLEHLLSSVSNQLLSTSENHFDEMVTCVLDDITKSFSIDMAYLILIDPDGHQSVWSQRLMQNEIGLSSIRRYVDAHPLVSSLVENHDLGTRDSELKTFMLTQKIQRWLRINANPNNSFILEFGLVSIHKDRPYRTDELSSLKHISQLFRLSINQRLFNENLYHLATTDALTGVHNRRSFLERLDEEILRFHRFEQPFCLMMLDLDHFKVVNDTHGHTIGDEVLKDFAQLIHQSLRDIDILGRIGGEEFCILLTNTSFEKGLVVAQRIYDALQEHHFKVEDVCLHYTASLGITEFKPSDTLQSVLDRVDQAMYHAKEQGRNTIAEL